MSYSENGGWGGIRTHETLSRLPVFKCGCGRLCEAFFVLFSPSFLAYPAYSRARHTGWCRAVTSSSLANRLAKGRMAMRGMSYDKIAKLLNAEGITGKQGGAFPYMQADAEARIDAALAGVLDD